MTPGLYFFGRESYFFGRERKMYYSPNIINFFAVVASLELLVLMAAR